MFRFFKNKENLKDELKKRQKESEKRREAFKNNFEENTQDLRKYKKEIISYLEKNRESIISAEFEALLQIHSKTPDFLHKNEGYGNLLTTILNDLTSKFGGEIKKELNKALILMIIYDKSKEDKLKAFLTIPKSFDNFE